MPITDTAPNVPLKNFKKTKIIATVGPATNSYEAVLDLIKAGANGIRLNFSHGSHEERTQQIKWIRKASKAYAKPVAIIQDLQGPKIRLGDVEDPIAIKKGKVYSFSLSSNYAESGHIPTQYDLSEKVKRGERIFMCDGKVRFVASSIKKGVVYADAENDGILTSRKGINLPDTDFKGDIITPKDKADLVYGSSQDVDFVAMSFVQTAQDIHHLRTLLKSMNSSANIIAKVETKAAIEQLEEIVLASDAIMVARGDLAVETEPESVPIIQQRIIDLGRVHAKPTIVATQMLASMSEASEPTRAEVSDIANAVLNGADCVMLSDETASGKFPLEAVKTMKRVIRYIQEHTPPTDFGAAGDDSSRQASIGKAIISLAENINAVAIVAETKSGATAYEIGSYRSKIPIIAVTSDARTAQQLSLAYNTKSYVRPVDAQAANKLTTWLHKNKVLHKGDVVVTASGKYPGVVGTTDTIKVRVIE